jgi:hypothetical protein
VPSGIRIPEKLKDVVLADVSLKTIEKGWTGHMKVADAVINGRLSATAAIEMQGAARHGDAREWKMKRAIQLQEMAALKTDIDTGLADVAAGRVKTSMRRRSSSERGKPRFRRGRPRLYPSVGG